MSSERSGVAYLEVVVVVGVGEDEVVQVEAGIGLTHTQRHIDRQTDTGHALGSHFLLFNQHPPHPDNEQQCIIQRTPHTDIPRTASSRWRAPSSWCAP